MRKSATSLPMILRQSSIPYVNDIVSEKHKSLRYSLVVRMLSRTRNLESFGSEHHSGRKSAQWHQKVSIRGKLSNPSLHKISDVVIILKLVLEPRSPLLKDRGHVWRASWWRNSSALYHARYLVWMILVSPTSCQDLQVATNSDHWFILFRICCHKAQ